MKYPKVRIVKIIDRMDIFNGLIEDLLHKNSEIVLTRIVRGKQTVIIELPCLCREYQFLQLDSNDCFYEAKYYFCSLHKTLLNE